MLAGLSKLYDDMEGDVEQIFGALGENPGKAIKYPPKDGDEFAQKVPLGVARVAGVAGQGSGAWGLHPIIGSQQRTPTLPSRSTILHGVPLVPGGVLHVCGGA